jgi:hypothetical protein
MKVKVYGEWGYGSTIFTVALDGGQWSFSHPSCLTPGERTRKYLLDRRMGGPQSLLECYREEKNLAFAGNQTLVIQTTILTELVRKDIF